MSSKVVTVTMGLAFLAAFSTSIMSQEFCDDMRASSSTEACADKPRCEDLTVTTCGDPDYSERFQVKEDFPKECIAEEDFNCNEPLENCYGSVNCEWNSDISACEPSGDPLVWESKKKKTTIDCESGEPVE